MCRNENLCRPLSLGTTDAVDTIFVSSADDEINLLVIVVDVNPIFWGQQAQRDPEVRTS